MSFKVLIDPSPRHIHTLHDGTSFPTQLGKTPKTGQKAGRERGRVRLGFIQTLQGCCPFAPNAADVGEAGPGRPRWPGTAPGPPRRGRGGTAQATAPPRRPRARLRAASPLGLPASPGSAGQGVEGASVCAAAALRGGPRTPGRCFPELGLQEPAGSWKHACPRRLVPKASATMGTRNRNVTRLTPPPFLLMQPWGKVGGGRNPP